MIDSMVESVEIFASDGAVVGDVALQLWLTG